jgi:ADP-ribose pyrophosphatase
LIPAAASPAKRWDASSATRLFVKIVVTLGLLVVLASKVNLRTVGERIAEIGFMPFAVCILATLVLTILVAWRWQMILVRMQNPVAFGESWRLVLIGLFFNQVLPSGIGGDAVRVWLLTRSGRRLRTAFLSVAADRIFALSAVILCMTGFLPVLLHGPAQWPVIFLTVAGALGFAALFVLPHSLGILARALPDRLQQAAGRLIARSLDLLRGLDAVLRLVLRARPEGPAVIGISVANQLVLGWIVYFIAGRLHVEIGLFTAIALFSPALLLSMLPISLGGWGVREAALVWLLGTANVPPDASLAISVLFGIVTTVASLAGGLLWLVNRRPQAPAKPPPSGSAPVPIPVVLKRRLSVVSPWVSVMARTIDYGSGKIEVYHAIEQADYIAILAVTPNFLIPIVRQYRPALERFTWELPAGMVDPGEDPAESCARELREETGLKARRIHALGSHAADSARLGNSIHSYLVETEDEDRLPEPEPGIVVQLVSIERLIALILSGEFDLQLHVATVGVALMQPSFARLLMASPSSRSPQ